MTGPCNTGDWSLSTHAGSTGSSATPRFSSLAECSQPLRPALSLTRKQERHSSMVITSTPLRISFFGGGTDYPLWYRRHGGSVLSTTINKCCYITCRWLPPFFDYHSRISYSKMENVA